MDKKSIIGLVLILLIFVTYSIVTQPSKEQLAAAKHKHDSIVMVEKDRQQKQLIQITKDSITQTSSPANNLPDSALAERKKAELGSFVNASEGTDSIVTIENELI